MKHASEPRGLAVVLLAFAVPVFGSEPADDFERVGFNHPGLETDLGVGLWAWPMPMDWDRDGDLDLVVSCPDTPYNGTYVFENPGGSPFPVFRPAVRVGPAMRNVQMSTVDGRPRVLTPGREWTGFLGGAFRDHRAVPGVPKLPVGKAGRIRANQWRFVDFDGDGPHDLVVGLGTWGDYGWDDAFNARGEWTRGPLHGLVYVARNTATDGAPKYAPFAPIEAGGRPVDVFGMPSPNLADFDGDGDLDLLCGGFLDGFTYFRNVGTRKAPRYEAGRPLPIHMDLQMITPTAVDWDGDGDVDLVVGDEDGRVALIEHEGRVEDGVPRFKAPRYFRQAAADLKFGALVTPVSVDWDGDGDEDLVCGNTAGYVGFIENLDGGNPPRWAEPRRLQAGGRTLRIQAGPNGSIQGPAEAKWGYTTLSAADWDHDGRPDLVVNSIWGRIVWYRNAPGGLEEARPVTVAWTGRPPKPAWNWWDPEGGELVTQWRTTPVVVDWNRDGLNDLVMLDHEGYLALFRREKRGEELLLHPGERIFHDDKGPLRLNAGAAGKSGRRKLCIVDWDGDGRRDLIVNSRSADLYLNGGTVDGKVMLKHRGRLGSRRLAGHTTSPTTVDWDRDGVRDLLVGAEDGHLYLLRRTPAPEKRAKRNVLFIVVDDLRVELGCTGSPIVKSPHIDRLASRGTLFNRAYCQQAVCNPSRASFLTGLRPETLGLWDLRTHFRERRPDIVTLPQLFKRNGYFTRGIGKIFHNWTQDAYKGDAPSWSVPAEMHYGTHGSDTPKMEGKIPPDLAALPRAECRDVPDEAYFDGRIAARAVAALRELRDRPFFLAVGFWKPHAPFNAPKRYWDLYDRAAITPPAHPEPPANAPSIALHDSREILRGYRDRPGGRPTAGETLALRHGYYAATSFADAQIGKVLDELDRLDLRKNTIVVFLSDHGYHLGEQSLWAKTSNFELDARVPLIISTPDHAPGKKADALVELLDLYPTLADLCGLDAPRDLEGVSLRPVLENSDAAVKPAAFTRHPRPAYPKAGAKPDAMGTSMRTPRYRYTEWRDHETGNVVARELYDHERDPAETRNIVDEEALVRTVKSLHEEMELMLKRPPGVIASEFIFTEAPHPQCHASTIVRAKEGLVAAWFGGKHEKNPDVGIWLSRRVDGAWTRPVEIVNGIQSPKTRHPCWNPVLFQPKDGPLMLFYKIGPDPSRWWGMLVTSGDGGKTWSKPRRLGEDPKIGPLLGPVKNKPVQLPDGAILCGSSTEHDGWRVHFELTRDLGRTWEVIGPIHDGKTFGAIQPSILNHKGGRLQVLCRSRQGVICQSWSEDGGRTWGKMTATPLPNPNAGTDAVTLADGRQLLVYNHTVRGGPFPSGRAMLNVAVSEDGRTWRAAAVLERAKGEYSYPAVIQAPDGRVHVTYTWQRKRVKHVVIDPDRLVLRPITDGKWPE